MGIIKMKTNLKKTLKRKNLKNNSLKEVQGNIYQVLRTENQLIKFNKIKTHNKILITAD
jgi:hypothetical protein